MLSAIVTLILLQVVDLASATKGCEGSNQRVLVAPKRSSPQAVNPTFVSSDSTYWLVDYTYSGASCTSKVVLKFGVATGYCFQTGATSSLKYTCTSGTVSQANWQPFSAPSKYSLFFSPTSDLLHRDHLQRYSLWCVQRYSLQPPTAAS